MPEQSFRPLTVGEILDQAFGLYRRYLPVLVTITLVCTALPQIGFLYIAGRSNRPDAILEIWPEYLLLLVALLVLNQVAVGASTLVLSEGYLGRTLSTGDALKGAWGKVGGIVTLSIFTSLVTFLGLILLFVPGLILIAGLAVATPALMIEPGLDAGKAMSRSWALTRGSRMRMIGMLFVTFLIIFVVAAGGAAVIAVIASVTGMTKNLSAENSPVTLNVISQVASVLVKTFLTPLVYCVLTVAYFDLRVRAEGFDLEILASTLPGA